MEKKLNLAHGQSYSVINSDITKPVQIADNLHVEPPTPEQIKDLRQRVGTQSKCAKLCGVNISNWQRFESGDRRPHPTTWGLFLLSTGQHPMYTVKNR